jgi:hypothetical protein
MLFREVALTIRLEALKNALDSVTFRFDYFYVAGLSGNFMSLPVVDNKAGVDGINNKREV